MGLFDLFRKNPDAPPKEKSQKEIARLTRVVSSKLSQDYERQEAIHILAAMGNAAGVKALLRRFDFNMDPSITDRDEKDAAAAGIVSAGEVALGPIRQYCATAESLTWPLKVARQLVKEEDFVDELLELLEQFDTEYVRNPEPKIQLISVLEEHPGDAVRLAVEPFLLDVNEGVRFCATGTVFAMDSNESVPALVEALEEEESLRIKNRVAGGIEQKQWSIPEALQERCRAALPDGFKLSGEGKLSRAAQ